MKSFLERVLNSVEKDDIKPTSKAYFVFPSRRAAYIFKDLIRRKFEDDIIFMPTVCSIEDFIFQLSRYTQTEEINLILELYPIYNRHNGETPLEKFYSWGSVMISDFDEIDKNLVDPSKIYANLDELAQLESLFEEDEPTLNALKQFSRLFQNDPKTKLHKKFLRSWNVMEKVYREFGETLSNAGISYPGMAYRSVAENLPDLDSAISKIVFAGFNALSKTEEIIFKYFLERGVGELYFDCDESFMSDSNDDAGSFLRRLKSKFRHSGVHWITEEMFENPDKEINVVGVSQKAAQAKVLSDLLNEKQIANSLDDDLPKTAIVLADENLLMPVVYSIPDSVSSFNITMGYPMRNTAIFHLIKSLFQIQIKKRIKKDDLIFHLADLNQVFRNSLIEEYYKHEVRVFNKWVAEHRIVRISRSALMEMGISELLPFFDSFRNGLEYLGLLSDKLGELVYRAKGKEENKSKESVNADGELLFQSVSSINMLIVRLKRHSSFLELEFTERVWSESFQALKLPFSGEPLSGLQIMGFLETRALDFENLIVLSVNENKLPASSSFQTFIPFGIRKAFEMHTYKERDAIYSYHFKRVLQRARTSYLIYDTEVAIDGSGEQSRYIKQLLYKRDTNKIKARIKEMQYLNGSALAPVVASTKIVIEKDDYVLNLMRKFSDNGDRLLSPTKLSNYIECSLRFYLRYVASIPEEEIEPGNLDPALFGNVFHKALELIYEPLLNRQIDPDLIDRMKEVSNIEKAVRTSLEENKMINKHKSVEGKEQLLISIVSRTISMILSKERELDPYELIGVEQRMERLVSLKNGNKVNLGGIVDRLDKVTDGGEHALRVVDYKSGKVEIQKSRNLTEEEYIDNYFTEPKFKAGFQTYFYSWILKENEGFNRFLAGIYSIRSLSSGMLRIRNWEVTTESILNYYEERLMSLVEEIFDPSIPFTQTDDVDRCTFCSYKTICNRHS